MLQQNQRIIIKNFATNQATTKPKIDNSFELLTGSPESIKNSINIFQIWKETGKVHGSQSHIIAANNYCQRAYESVKNMKNPLKVRVEEIFEE